MNKLERRPAAYILAAALLGFSSMCRAQYRPAAASVPAGTVPGGINYQGHLVDNGVPVTATRNMTFRLYDAPGGGNLLWSGGVQPVPVSQGVFGATLAISTTALSGPLQKYLEVQVDNTTLSPREPLNAVPYALIAKSLEENLMISSVTIGSRLISSGTFVAASAFVQSLNNVFYADAFTGGDAGAKIQACMNALPASGGTCDARGLVGAQTAAATISIPANVTLLLGAMTLTTAASPGVSVAVGSSGSSGRLIGTGANSVISYTGSGHAVQLFTGSGGQPLADVTVAGLKIVGTSSGASGIRLVAFNLGTLSDVFVSGFASGDGIRSEGANTISCFGCNVSGNRNGVHNLTTIVGGNSYSSNVINFFGGQIGFNTGWGVYEDPAGGGGVNENNMYSGVVFELNGTNGSASSGQAFVQYGVNVKFIGCYFEYAGATPPVNEIVIGDAVYKSLSTQVLANWFGGTGSVNTVNNVNGDLTRVDGNEEAGVVTNFINNGSASSNLIARGNRASAAARPYAGSDAGIAALADFGSVKSGTPGITLGIEAAERPKIEFNQSDASRRFWFSVNDVNLSTERLSLYAGPLGQAASKEAMVFGGNGNVGIGTTSPQQALEVNGGARLNTGAAQPVCGASTRGTFWVVQSGSGTKDNVQVCAKDASDVYAWRTIY